MVVVGGVVVVVGDVVVGGVVVVDDVLVGGVSVASVVVVVVVLVVVGGVTSVDGSGGISSSGLDVVVSTSGSSTGSLGGSMFSVAVSSLAVGVVGVSDGDVPELAAAAAFGDDWVPFVVGSVWAGCSDV